MTYEECFSHPLWYIFAQYAEERGIHNACHAWLGREDSWMPYWLMFLAGVEAENKRMLEEI